MRLPTWLGLHLAALRALLVLTVVLGLAYPLAMTAVAHVPGLKHHADGSVLSGPGGKKIGSALLGQSFTDADGKPLVQYLQSRPSAAGLSGYDPTSSGASNLGPESIVDVVPDLRAATDSDAASGKQSLLTQVCARSQAVARWEGIDGRRPFCTSGPEPSVGAVLAVFRSKGLVGVPTRVVSMNQACPAAPFIDTWEGVRVQCTRAGEDLSRAVVTPVCGDAPAQPVVPADAVTASGSGLDPHISPDYAHLQAARVARARGVEAAVVQSVIDAHTSGRFLGVGVPVVDVLAVNLELDRNHPNRS